MALPVGFRITVSLLILLPKLRGSDSYPGGTVSHRTRQPSLDAQRRLSGKSFAWLRLHCPSQALGVGRSDSVVVFAINDTHPAICAPAGLRKAPRGMQRDDLVLAQSASDGIRDAVADCNKMVAIFLQSGVVRNNAMAGHNDRLFID